MLCWNGPTEARDTKNDNNRSHCKWVTNSGQSVFRLKLFSVVKRVIDESETSCLSTSKLRPETEAEDNVSRCLVQATQFLSYLCLRYGWPAGMKNIDHLQNRTKGVSMYVCENVCLCTNTCTSLSLHTLYICTQRMGAAMLLYTRVYTCMYIFVYVSRSLGILHGANAGRTLFWPLISIS